MSNPPPMPPTMIGYATPAGMGRGGYSGMWRDGDKIVATVNAPWPPRCVKCNADVGTSWRWRKTLSWAHPALMFMILFPGLLIWAIVYLIVKKSSKVDVALCPQHRAARRNKILIAWLIALASVASFFLAAYVSSLPGYRNSPLTPGIVIGGIVGLIGAAVFGIIGGAVIRPTKIDAVHAKFSGAGRPFLLSLPGIDGTAPGETAVRNAFEVVPVPADVLTGRDVIE